MPSRTLCAILASATLFASLAGACAAEAERPNVLFIAIDDLNDWVGCLEGHPQALTPNLDRLARTAVLFTEAHCAAPACSPSRTAVFTGRSPHRSGLYDNSQHMRAVMPDAEILPKVFSRHGYHAAGAGKLLHFFIDPQSWDDYFPDRTGGNPLPRTLTPVRRPVSLPRAGAWQYSETDWAALDATDPQYGGDYLVAEWISQQLSEERDQPFFLACGIYRPHEPWFVPQKYFEPFPLERIQLPPGYRADDLADLPPEGRQRGPNRYFAHIRNHGQWKRAIQAYLASIHFADAMLGRVLDALEQGPYADNTIVVVWSDHGWHLGEKQHWQKYTAWRVCTRVPLVIRVPKGAPGLANGTRSTVCNQPVNLLSLFPTLLDLCGLPAEAEHDGPSLVPLLQDPPARWPHASVTYLNEPGAFGLSTQHWRYIRYAGGDEELYNVACDPHEWVNLTSLPQHAAKLAELRNRAPESFAPRAMLDINALPKLSWIPSSDGSAPASDPYGDPLEIFFTNRSDGPVQLYWIDRHGNPAYHTELSAGQQHRQHTREGAVWRITSDTGETLGHFRIAGEHAEAVIR